MKIVIETERLSRQECIGLMSFFATLVNNTDALIAEPTALPDITPEAVAEIKRTPDEAFGAAPPQPDNSGLEAIMAQNEQPFTGAPLPTEEVDSAGEIWDPTKHATSGTTGKGVKNADGTWRARAKRGGSPTPAPAPAPAPMATGDVPAPPPPQPAGMSDFAAFMQKLTNRAKLTPSITQDAIRIAQEHGTTLPGLTSRPDVVAIITAQLGL